MGWPVCGIVGFLQCGRLDTQADAHLCAMRDALVHRGPDDRGCWLDADCGVGLGHRRLSIVDVSDAGRQPMQSASSRYVIVFNGEIYNHRDIRSALEKQAKAPAWRGSSDTESLLAAVDAWGLEATLKRAEGMFALALWDRERRVLMLARDRIGEKPLYFGWQDSRFFFASELAALRQHPAFKAEIDAQAARDMIEFGYVRAPRSIYTGIGKVEPGCYHEISREGSGPAMPYWRFADAALAGAAQRFAGDFEDAVDAVEQRLHASVSRQLVADVPLGAFLSGGVDSSVVTALMQAQSSRPVRTFSIGFEESGFDESDHAAAVAQHLGTDHTRLYVTEQDALDLVPDLGTIYDEPFADASQIPTTLLSRLTRDHVTVALSGDGGDELFGGYTRHTQGVRLWRRMARLPRPLRLLAAQGARLLSTGQWDALVSSLERHVARRALINQPGRKIDKAALALSAVDEADYYHRLLCARPNLDDVMHLRAESGSAGGSGDDSFASLEFSERMMAWDTSGYLANDVLVKVDRAAMSASLETRVPMLSPALIELAWSLPPAFKTGKGVGKRVLREVLYRHVPRSLVERPKAGFDVPVAAWLRGGLRDWAEQLLDRRRLAEQGFFNVEPIQREWREHIASRADNSRRLWPVLMFQAWLQATV